MHKIKKILSAILINVLVVMCFNVQTVQAVESVNDGSSIVYGADVGWLSQLEKEGITWVNDNGVTSDALQLLKDKGVNAIRIRAFVNPDSSFQWTKPDGTTCWLGYADTTGVLYTAQRAKNLGMKISIVLHYSDYFADPLYHDIPGQWSGATAEELTTYVYDYTYYLMNELKKLDIYPEWVEVGNEVNGGILSTYGSSTENFEQLTEYLNSGYDAVKAVSPNTQVVTHLANMGHGLSDFTWFLDEFLNVYNGKTDIIGISNYPYWIGTNDIEGLSYMLYELVNQYGKDVMICETGGAEDEADLTYDLLREEINALNAVPNNRGIAIFYWEPEANSEMLPDGYILGATEKVNDKVYKFTNAMDAFKIAPTFLSNETSFEIQNINSGKAVNVQSGSWDNSAAIEQYDYGKWDSQKWYFEEVEDGYYKIVNKLSGKVLEVSSMSTATGAPCIQYEYNGGWNQMWSIISTDDGKYKLQNRLSGLYLGIKDKSESDGAACVQLADDGSDNIKWYFLVTE